jgi:hypothetical protein
MKKANWGQIRIIEAFFAVLIVFAAFAVAPNVSESRNTMRSNYLTSVGLEILMKLDQSGMLSNYVASQDFSKLQGAINLILPSGIFYSITVYDERMQQVNADPVTNGLPNSLEIAFVEYISGTQDTVFRCYVIHMQLAMAT